MELRRTGRGPEIVEVPPTHCANGHALVPPNVQVFYGVIPGPERKRARGWRCWTCDTVIWDGEPL